MLKADWQGMETEREPNHNHQRGISWKPGELSAQCKKGKHDLHCTKLDCPCACHKAEGETE